MNAAAEVAVALACGTNTDKNIVTGKRKTHHPPHQKKQIDNIHPPSSRIKSSKKRSNRTLLVQISYILHHCCKYILF